MNGSVQGGKEKLDVVTNLYNVCTSDREILPLLFERCNPADC